MSEVVLDDKEWKEFLKMVSDKMLDAGKYLLAAANIFGFKDIIEHFDKEEGPGGAWPKRKAETDRAYDIMGKNNARYSSSNKLLQLTGNLRKSFLPGSQFIKREGKLAVKLFSDPSLIYARVHDEGSERMPQREFMWLSDKAQELMLTMIMDQLVD